MSEWLTILSLVLCDLRCQLRFIVQPKGGGGPEATLGRFICVRDNFHLNFICRWLCPFTRSETAVTQIYINEADLQKKMLGGRHFMVLNSMNFIYAVSVIWSCIDKMTQCVQYKSQSKIIPLQMTWTSSFIFHV